MFLRSDPISFFNTWVTVGPSDEVCGRSFVCVVVGAEVVGVWWTASAALEEGAAGLEEGMPVAGGRDNGRVETSKRPALLL